MEARDGKNTHMNQAITKIVTHPGSAHKDEFLAICLAAHKTGCTQIERRVATDADLNDPSVMVVDQGRQYNPKLNNFDHHQDRNLQSSYPLVAQHFGLEAALKLYDKAYQTLDIEDREGPGKAGSHFGLTVEQYFALSDPISIAMVNIFSGYAHVPPDFAAIMEKIGANMVKRALEYRPDYERLASTAEIKEVDGVKYLVDRQDESVAREDFAREKGITVIVTPDNRVAGWKLKRVDDQSRVDFRNAAALPDLDPAQNPQNFIHATGFLAVTTNPNADIEQIIRASLVAEQTKGRHSERIGKRDPLQPDGTGWSQTKKTQ